jgi:hypothetical protein
MKVWVWRIAVCLAAIPFTISWASFAITREFWPIVILAVCLTTATVNVNILLYYLASLAPYAIGQKLADDLDDLTVLAIVALVEISVVSFMLGAYFIISGGCGIGRIVC